MKKKKLMLPILGMLMVLAACGEKEKGSGEETAVQIDKNAVYREEEVPFSITRDTISSVMIVGENIYVDQVIYGSTPIQPRTDVSPEKGMEETKAIEENLTKEPASVGE